MCMSVYLFTNNAVDDIEFDKERPALFLRPATQERERNISGWGFPRKSAYYIGSYQGCGCRWALTANAPGLDEADIAAIRADRARLLTLFRSVDFSGAFLVMCWEGEQGKPLWGEKTLTAQTLCGAGFALEELVAYRLI